MTQTFEQFGAKLIRASNRMPRTVDRLLARTAFKFVENVVPITPVDTGQARSNWLASVGSPRTEIVEPRDVGATIADAQAALAVNPNGAPIFVVNNVDYIGDLNAGSSPQASPQFVERAFQIAASSVGTVDAQPILELRT